MLESHGIIIVILLSILVLIGLYNKQSKFCFGLIFVCMIIFAICVNDSYDISNYRYSYEGFHPHAKEPLFDIIQFYFRGKGWSFETFKAVWVSIVYILLFRGIKKYSEEPAAVAALSIISPFMSFITQMRAAIAGAIILNAYSLLQTNRKRDRVLYAIIVILIAQVHSIAYLFLIFLLIKPDDNRTFNSLYYRIAGILIVVALLFSANFTSIIDQLLSALYLPGGLSTRVMTYFEGEGNSARYKIFLAIKRLMLFWLTDRACDELLIKNSNNTESIQKLNVLKETNIISLIFIPIAILSASFERTFYWLMFIQYAAIFSVGDMRIIVFSRVNINGTHWTAKLQSLLVFFVFIIFLIELFFSPTDFVTMMNSVSIFK